MNLFFDLPIELQYHLHILEVLSCCTVGRANMSSIEAKVQSVYEYEDVIDGILDPRCFFKCQL